MECIATEKYENINIEFYIEEGQIWIKRRDLGEALDYSFPSESTAKLHSRNRKLLQKHTRYELLDDPNGRRQETALYDSVAVSRFCCISFKNNEKFLRWYHCTIARMENRAA